MVFNGELSRCQVFELLAGEPLFDTEAIDGDGKFEDDHLAQMMDLWGERYPAKFLDKSPIRS